MQKPGFLVGGRGSRNQSSYTILNVGAIRESPLPNIEGIQSTVNNTGEMTADNSIANRLVAGVDEVGRGCLFGPVVAASAILSPEICSSLAQMGVKDSKKLTANQRERLAKLILAQALDCKIGIASVAEIDRLNILQASLLAMRRSLLKLSPQPELCLVDGNQKIPGLSIPQSTIVQGDSKSVAIAAASILAKVWRDRLIVRLAAQYPEYDLINNKGYGTKRHRQALALHGVSSQHRRSFSPCQIDAAKPQQLSMFNLNNYE